MEKIVTRRTVIYFFVKRCFIVLVLISEVEAANTILSPFFMFISNIRGHIGLQHKNSRVLALSDIRCHDTNQGQNKFICLAKLHIEIRITCIHTSFNTIVNHLKVAAGCIVLMRALVNTSKCHERLES